MSLIAIDIDVATPTLIAEVDMRTDQELVPVDTGPSLAECAASINKHIEKALSADMSANRHRLRAGQELIEARKRVPHGEWIAWCEKNINRGMRDIQKLMQMAGAPDPEAALDQERARARDGMAALRANTSNVTRISSPTIIEGECADITPVAGAEPVDPGWPKPPATPEPVNPAELLAAIKPHLDVMSDADVRGFGKMITDYLIDRPELSAAA